MRLNVFFCVPGPLSSVLLLPLPSQTPAASALLCQRPLCVSSWRWWVTTPSSWVEQSVRMSPSPPPPCPALPLLPPRPSSARPFAKRSLPRAWGGFWRCSWRPRCSPASSRRGICADRVSEVLRLNNRPWCYSLGFIYWLYVHVEKYEFQLNYCMMTLFFLFFREVSLWLIVIVRYVQLQLLSWGYTVGPYNSPPCWFICGGDVEESH